MNRIIKYNTHEFGHFKREGPDTRLGKRALSILAAVEEKKYSESELWNLLRKIKSPTGTRTLWACFNEVCGELRQAGRYRESIDDRLLAEEWQKVESEFKVTRSDGMVSITWGGHFLCSFMEDTQNYCDPFVKATGGFKWAVGGTYNWCESAEVLLECIKSRCFHSGDSKKWGRVAKDWEDGPSKKQTYVDDALERHQNDPEGLDKAMRLKGLATRIINGEKF